VQTRTYERQQIELEKTRDFIRRNHYGQKHAQAEDRRKKLEKMEQELVPPPRSISAPPMRFPAAPRSGDLVVRAEHLSKSYERTLFSEVTLDVCRGQRWGLLGPNGCGKTTLLKCLLGLVEPDAGRVNLGQGLELGYFDQQLAGLADDAQVVDAVRPKKKEFNEQQRRDMLAKFGITGDTALQKVASLSGGERCRAALARLAAEEANFLVLDEPTNHLDLWARDSLEKAIHDFDGTVLFVSHDRYFVNQVADHLLIVEPGRIRVIQGNYETFLMLEGRRASSAENEANSSNKKTGTPSDKNRSQNAASATTESKTARKRRFPYRKAEAIEKEIQDRESAVEYFQQQLLLPENLRVGDRIRSLKNQIAAEQETLKTLYEHWEEALELNW
jgi:ATP-binding cassette subfamily F protein 3